MVLLLREVQEGTNAMRKVSIDSIVGGERLAKEISTTNGLVLIPAGSFLKYEYVAKMRELNIDMVYIEQDEITSEVEVSIEEILQRKCKNMVKEIIQKYSYCANQKLQDIIVVAEEIIEEVLTQPEVMYNVSCIREKSESIYSHSVSVSALSVLIGIRMGLSRERVRELAIGALLHDLGMVYLPFSCENLIYEQCDDTIKKEIRKHVITGYSMVESETWLSPTSKEIILSHHEREDGSGYPMRLTKTKTRLETKIVALCDEFDSYVYGNLVKPQKIHLLMDYILSEADRKFNLEVVHKFIESVAVYPIGTYVKTNTSEIGIVVGQNYKMPTRPVIQMVGLDQEEPVYMDLVKELTVFIKDTVDIA